MKGLRSLEEFYTSVCGCPNSEAECPGTINSASTGWPPRGFFTEARDAAIEILVVGKNPGHPIPQERERYEGRSSAEIARSHLDFARSVFRDEEDRSTQARRSTRFHKNLRRYIAYFLDVPESAIFQRAAYTNLVKCSTVGEQDRLRPETMRECFGRHFVREIEFLGPRVLLALGREVERFLKRSGKVGDHGLPVIYVKHPSYHYARDREAQVLREIKSQIQFHLRA